MVLTILYTNSKSIQFPCCFLKSRPLSLAYKTIYDLASMCLSRENSNQHSDQTGWSLFLAPTFCLSFLISTWMSSFLPNSVQVKILPTLVTSPGWEISSFSGGLVSTSLTLSILLWLASHLSMSILSHMLDCRVLRPRIIGYLFCMFSRSVVSDSLQPHGL